MKRAIVILAVLVAGFAVAAEQYVYVEGGKIKSKPRQLPSVGIRQDTGATVIGLHGAGDSIRAACGWYRIEPDKRMLMVGQVVTGRSYTVGRGVVHEVLQVGERKVITVADRVRMLFDAPELQGMSDDQRASAVIAAVAQAVTGRVDRAVTVTIPAREVGGVIGGIVK